MGYNSQQCVINKNRGRFTKTLAYLQNLLYLCSGFGENKCGYTQKLSTT